VVLFLFLFVLCFVSSGMEILDVAFVRFLLMCGS